MPRAWYGENAEYLLFCGYSLSSTNSNIFGKHTTKFIVIFCLNVDDLIVIGYDVDKVYDNYLYILRWKNIHFEMKELGEFGYFLGIEVAKLKDGYFIC